MASSHSSALLDDDEDWEVSPEFAAQLASSHEINEIPLFADTLPSNVADNPAFEALQSLIYDDETPESLAMHFKKTGNEYVQSGPKFYEDAILSYTKGIEAKCRDYKLQSQLYSNRAYIYFLTRDFVKCIDDCRAAIETDASNLKACIRAAKASFRLDLFQQSLEFTTSGLEIHEDNKELLQLMQSNKERLKLLNERKSEQNSRDKKLAEQKALADLSADSDVLEILDSRGVRMVETTYVFPEQLKAKIYRDSDFVLHWPVILLIDEYQIAEFICDFVESNCFSDYLKNLFPGDSIFPQWDKERKYKWNELQAYYEPLPNANTAFDVPLDASLYDILNYVKIASPSLAFHVVLKDSKVKSLVLSNFTVSSIPVVSQGPTY